MPNVNRFPSIGRAHFASLAAALVGFGGFVSFKAVNEKEKQMSAKLDLAAGAAAPKDAQAWMSAQTKDDLARLVMAGASSVVAQFFTHPVETVKTRMQVEGNALAPGQVARYGNVVSGTKYVLQHEGMKGLYKVCFGFLLMQKSMSSFKS